MLSIYKDDFGRFTFTFADDSASTELGRFVAEEASAMRGLYERVGEGTHFVVCTEDANTFLSIRKDGTDIVRRAQQLRAMSGNPDYILVYPEHECAGHQAIADAEKLVFMRTDEFLKKRGEDLGAANRACFMLCDNMLFSSPTIH